MMRNWLFKLLFRKEYDFINDNIIVAIAPDKGTDCIVKAIWIDYPDGEHWHYDLPAGLIVKGASNV